ncbi:HepT-like ribonuclease domain-containing protein [uncultured Muribaculum sp.]|uniref:HepT-like ribonuclease domain-containing protein n=1 Tax=uncultured Muribaculum sp. TaxID=1918613 RepID=UPI0025FC166F|nr:HepT-like ribonuclease domain-containing protein [uncultured Muribaculum sp.]
MDRKTLKYLNDIYSAILEIESFMESRPKEYATFCNDTLFRRGVERNIEIMGEAMNQILKVVPDIPITSSRKIVDTRNFVIHAYDSLRPDILWSIVINNLPLLKKEIIQLLDAK